MPNNHNSTFCPSATDFLQAKSESRKLSMVTCYDYTFAGLLSRSAIDGILVGDSAAMVVYGHPSTLSATVSLMRQLTEAVARGAGGKLVVTDMPFLSYRKGVAAALDSAHELMNAGAHAVKLEGVDGHEDVIQRLAQSGIPVMGHLGLQPQSVHTYGGFRIQGRSEAAARDDPASSRRAPGTGSLRRGPGMHSRLASSRCDRTPCGFPPSGSARARDATGRFWCSRICWA
jgi:3-methyl-2-oxobutanoate hydroxymethyltransferase